MDPRTQQRIIKESGPIGGYITLAGIALIIVVMVVL